jgi:hypothetical protein
MGGYYYDKAHGIVWKHTALCVSYHTVLELSVGLAMLTFGFLIPTENVI